MKKLPIGMDDFKALIEENCYFVDKSMLLKEIWQDNKYILITRPRRFGKTLNMSMMKYFFDINSNTPELFQGLDIVNDEEMLKHMGKYPVIFLSFRGCGGANLEITKGLIKLEIERELRNYEFLEEYLTEQLKADFKELKKLDNEYHIIKSINILSRLIEAATGVKPILLIDEYDNPINNAYVGRFYEPLINFLKPFYENTLKDNNSIQKAVITGVLRVSKESIFSGLNSLTVSTILGGKYTDKFGFTEDEVKKYLAHYNIEYTIEDVKDYYNGYRFGDSEIFNPWSILNYSEYMLGRSGSLSKTFWINTSSNDIVRNILINNPDKYKKDIEALIKGEAIHKIIDENTSFKYLTKDTDIPWTLLLFSGYLNVVNIINPERNKVALKIPNKEIRYIYQQIILDWVSAKYDVSDYDNLVEALINGDLEEFTENFKDMLFSTMSFFDPSGEKPENFYHGFVLGILAILIDTHDIQYNIKSNREAGNGRADVMIIPKDKSKTGIVIEFKKSDSKDLLMHSAETSLKQIAEKRYVEELNSLGINQVISVGISFYGKDCEVLWK
jgi:hypothetical protein